MGVVYYCVIVDFDGKTSVLQPCETSKDDEVAFKALKTLRPRSLIVYAYNFHVFSRRVVRIWQVDFTMNKGDLVTVQLPEEYVLWKRKGSLT